MLWGVGELTAICSSYQYDCISAQMWKSRVLMYASIISKSLFSSPLAQYSHSLHQWLCLNLCRFSKAMHICMDTSCNLTLNSSSILCTMNNLHNYRTQILKGNFECLSPSIHLYRSVQTVDTVQVNYAQGMHSLARVFEICMHNTHFNNVHLSICQFFLKKNPHIS